MVSVVELIPILLWFASLGWLVIRLRPGHRIGWLLLVSPLLIEGAFVGIGAGGQLADELPAFAGIVGAFGVALLTPAVVVLLGFLPLLFPDGHLPGPRWRQPAAALAFGIGAILVCFGLTPGQVDPSIPANPLAIPWLPEELKGVGSAVSILVILLATVLGIASIATRYRRGRGVEREQVKWLLAALVAAAAAVVPTFMGVDWDVLSFAGSLAIALIPAAVTVAILRYRLYDIDRLISRTITYALVTVVIAGIFVAGSLAIQAVLANLTHENTLAVAGSTLLAVAAAQPVRRRIQSVVDRRFDRARFDAARTVAAFAARQGRQVDLSAVEDDVIATTRDTLHPATTAIWLRQRGAGGHSALVRG